MFSQYVFVKKANGRYYYRSHGCTLEWDLSFTVERLWQYTGHGLPVPPDMEQGDETPQLEMTHE